VGRFFLSTESEAKEKTAYRETKLERQRARGKDREAGRASAKQLHRLARSRAVPKGRPEGPSRSEAEWARSPVEVEKRRAAKRNREVAFALQNRATGKGKKQAGQVCVQILIGISTEWAHSGGGSLKRGTHGQPFFRIFLACVVLNLR
jgi:hypothetical protein